MAKEVSPAVAKVIELLEEVGQNQAVSAQDIVLRAGIRSGDTVPANPGNYVSKLISLARPHLEEKNLQVHSITGTGNYLVLPISTDKI